MSAAECYDVSVVIVDGEHESVAESYPESCFWVVGVSLASDSGLAELAAFVAIISGPLEE